MKKRNTSGLKIICAGALVFVALYFAIFMPYEEKKEVLLTDIMLLETELSSLEVHEPNAEKYKQSIEDAKFYIDTEIKRYPSDVTPEDTILWALSLKNTVGGDFSQIGFSEKTDLFEFQTDILIDDAYQNKLLKVQSIASSYQGEFTYDQLKNALDFIYSTNHRTALNSINISYDTEEEIATVNLDIVKYIVTYDGAIYEPLTLPRLPIGDTNIFE